MATALSDALDRAVNPIFNAATKVFSKIGKKGQIGMMHQFDAAVDPILIIIGIAIGLYLAKWGMSKGYLPVGFFCPAPVELIP